MFSLAARILRCGTPLCYVHREAPLRSVPAGETPEHGGTVVSSTLFSSPSDALMVLFPIIIAFFFGDFFSGDCTSAGACGKTIGDKIIP